MKLIFTVAFSHGKIFRSHLGSSVNSYKIMVVEVIPSFFPLLRKLRVNLKTGSFHLGVKSVGSCRIQNHNRKTT